MTALLASVGWCVIYGVSNKAIVDYKMSGPKTWAIFGDTIQFYGDRENGPLLQISFDCRNRGQTDLVISYRIGSTNATLSFNLTGPFTDVLSSSVKITGNSPDWGSVYFHVRPNANVASFAVQIDSASKVPDYTFPDVFPNFFSEVTPYGSTFLKYQLTPNVTNEYQLAS